LIFGLGIQMRIAIYARVSTDDKGQDPENQLRQLRDWCAHAGHEIVHEYVDKESGRKGTKGTPSSSGRSIASVARGWCRPFFTSSG
jgi:DNA invertase Pin-like site-specific DNA recombinase